MFSPADKTTKSARYVGNAHVSLYFFNPPMRMPLRDGNGVVQVDEEGIPIAQETQMLLKGHVEILDEEGELFSTHQIMVPTDEIRAGASSLMQDIIDSLVGEVEPLDNSIAPRHESRTHPGEKEYESLKTKAKQRGGRMNDLKEKRKRLDERKANKQNRKAK